MKTLIVLRHGKAEHHSSDGTDFDRGLTRQGLQDSTEVGSLLKARNLVPDYIVSSSAKRARMTADCVARECGCSAGICFTEQIYEASVPRLFSVVQEIDESAQVALIAGHNPGLWGLVESLSEPVPHYPTCAWTELQIDVEHWGEVTGSSQADLATFWHPGL